MFETDTEVTGSLAQSLQDSTLIALYQELAAEDVALAEAGIADYQQGLELADCMGGC